ncbi:hypothetical protein KA012_04440, partial [Candidatus Woesebacteria bacterium]|nr:hypothetical protein [Candidatus Woesebacteria bacterium]
MHSFFNHKATPKAELELVLGMDGGGTKTEVLLADLDGNIVAEFTGGPTNLAAVPESVAMDNLEEALA